MKLSMVIYCDRNGLEEQEISAARLSPDRIFIGKHILSESIYVVPSGEKIELFPFNMRASSSCRQSS